MEIVTGSTGVAHVTPIDDAVRNSNYGYYSDKVVFDIFRAFEAVAVTANEVRVYGGYGMNQGRIFKIDESEYDPVTIENGSQGVRRSDLIVARYTMDTQTGFEDISLAVIKGESGDTYTDPSYTEGAINEGATLDDFPLYRVKVNGIVIEDVEPLFEALPEGGRIGAIEKKVNDHIADDENPHTIAWEESVDLEYMDILDTMATIFGKIAKAISVLISHVGNKNNPHEVKGSQLVASGASEAVPISKGGTGAITAAGALANLGVPSDVANAASKSYVRNRLVNSVESSTTATAHHDVGDFIIYGGNDTYARVTAEINIDDTIEDGVNVDNESVGEELTVMKSTFQNGVDTIYNAIVAEGVTPASSTPTDCAVGISDVATAKFGDGRTQGRADKNSFTIEFKRGSLIMDNGGAITLYNLQILVNGIDILAFTGGTNWTLAVNKPTAASTSKTAYASYTSRVTTS